MEVGDRVHMKDTGRAGTIAAVHEGEGAPTYSVVLDAVPDEMIGGIALLEPEPATMIPGLPADAFEPIA
jgi:hypothetical protein